MTLYGLYDVTTIIDDGRQQSELIGLFKYEEQAVKVRDSGIFDRPGQVVTHTYNIKRVEI